MQVSGHIRKRVKKDGSASYQITIELPTDPITGSRNRIFKTIKGTKKQAEKVMRTMMDDIENHTFVKDNNSTVASWVEEWFSLYLKDLSPTTLAGYKYQIENYILNQPIGKVRLQDLTTSDVQKWINDLSVKSPVSKKPMSSKTIKNIYHNLCAAIDKALVLDIVKKNVCKAVTLPKVEKLDIKVYDELEIQTLISASKGTDMELIITMAVSLGLRRGELAGLKWKHIDFENKVVNIKENLVEVRKEQNPDRIITKAPKSKSGVRSIAISDTLCRVLKSAHTDYLKRRIKLGCDFYDGGYVICQENGRPFKPASISKKFNKFLDNNNLRHIRLHDVRHTNATLMLMNGIPPKVAQARLGHSDYSTTMNIYGHVLKSAETESAEKIENILFNAI